MKGQCLCGAVAFEILGKVPDLYQCHCSECRKETGSFANTATFVHVDSFRWIDGVDKISSFRKDTGYRSDFCSVCGSPAPNPLRNTDKMWIPAGLLEEADDVSVKIHLHMNSRASWEETAQNAEIWDGSLDIEELNNALQRTSR